MLYCGVQSRVLRGTLRLERGLSRPLARQKRARRAARVPNSASPARLPRGSSAPLAVQQNRRGGIDGKAVIGELPIVIERS